MGTMAEDLTEKMTFGPDGGDISYLTFSLSLGF